ncbi:hypothetical protein J6590_081754 [Homalodisca vitripennis]|nr:hypothetical protein J6590_081754 [Homalodisca vitripennis]
MEELEVNEGQESAGGKSKKDFPCQPRTMIVRKKTLMLSEMLLHPDSVMSIATRSSPFRLAQVYPDTVMSVPTRSSPSRLGMSIPARSSVSINK